MERNIDFDFDFAFDFDFDFDLDIDIDFDLDLDLDLDADDQKACVKPKESPPRVSASLGMSSGGALVAAGKRGCVLL